MGPQRYFGGETTPFRVGAVTCSWADWRAKTKFDTHSAYRATRPTGVTPSCARTATSRIARNLVIYNWEKTDTVSIDVSTFLRVGEDYTVIDAQNYGGADSPWPI